MSTVNSAFHAASNYRKGAAIAVAALVAIIIAALMIAIGVRSTSATHGPAASPNIATSVVDRAGVPEHVVLYLAPTTYESTSIPASPSGSAARVDDPVAPNPQVLKWLALSR